MSKGTATITVIPVLFNQEAQTLKDTYLVLKCTNTKAVKPFQLVTHSQLEHLVLQHITTIMPTRPTGRNDK